MPDPTRVIDFAGVAHQSLAITLRALASALDDPRRRDEPSIRIWVQQTVTRLNELYG